MALEILEWYGQIVKGQGVGADARNRFLRVALRHWRMGVELPDDLTDKLKEKFGAKPDEADAPTKT